MDLEQCKKGHHEYITVFNEDYGYDGEVCVEWCQNCGWCVVNNWVDGRLMNKIFSQAPRIFKEGSKNV